METFPSIMHAVAGGDELHDRRWEGRRRDEPVAKLHSTAGRGTVEQMRESGQMLLAVVAAAAMAAVVIVARPSAPTGTQPTSVTFPTGAIVATGSSTAGATPSPAESATATPSTGPAAPVQELPRGGTEIFPANRLVGFSGAEGSAAFGRLGIGSLDARIDEIERRARAYDSDRTVLPVLELITVVVQAHPGDDGLYRSRSGDAQIQRYLDAARRHKALLLLDIQPGRADMLAEVKALDRWLKEPDVGIALDPEWAIGKGQVPGRVFGRTSAAKLNEVARYLGDVVERNTLPEKALVVHQLAPRIISGVPGLKPVDGVATVLSVDGIGARADKVATWKKLVKPLPEGIHPGFKLFFEEDRRAGSLMTPKQVLALRPRPGYVLYE